MKRATIRIYGRVQKAGFRDTVDELTYHLELVGYVKNLDKDIVEVVCEGEEENIRTLVEKLDIKQYPIRVERIEAEYSEPTGEYTDFTIIREEDITTATYERMDAAVRYMREMNHDLGEKIDNVGENVQQNIVETRKVGENVQQNILETRGFREDTIACFDSLDEKYHVVSENLASMNENLTRLVDGLTTLIKNYVEKDEK